jgi:glucokinase
MGLLLADIGGTNTRCALGDATGTGPVATYRNDDFPTLADLLSRHLDALAVSARPRTAVLAVAAPIQGDEVRMMNRAWTFSSEELRQRLGLDRLELLNDFAALAWALPVLAPTELAQIGGGSAVAEAPRVVLGPGTGLGVASLAPVAGGWLALPGEGGHVTMPAQDEAEEAVIRAGRARYGHCSAERLLSGPGLSFLHAALHGGPELPPDEIGRRLRAGEAPAAATFAVFFRLLGTVAADAALILGALGGVYLGGGIVPRYVDVLARSDFRRRFEAKGRYAAYLGAIPTLAITAANPAIAGLLAFARARQLL